MHTDSLRAVNKLNNRKLDLNTITRAIRNAVSRLTQRPTINWIAAHTGIPYNKNADSVHTGPCRIYEQSGPNNKQQSTTHGNAPKGSGSYLRPKTYIQHTHPQLLDIYKYVIPLQIISTELTIEQDQLNTF